jgi:predicted RNA-binding Zn-ribbon protein involved in translation (DUF1610 family)
VTCTLCGRESEERAIAFATCPRSGCGAQLSACPRCGKTIASSFAEHPFGATLIQIALASRHGCPNPGAA